MPYTPTRLAGPTQPATGGTTLFTVPTAHTYIVSEIVLANTTGSNATVTVGVGGTTAALQIIPTVTVPPNTVVVYDLSVPLAAAETLQAAQGTTGAITVTVGGADVT